MDDNTKKRGRSIGRRLPLALAAAALALSGCSANDESAATSDDAATDLAFVDEQLVLDNTTSTLIAAAPDVRLSEADSQLVRFEAQWVCEVQRRTFQTPNGRDEALLENLGEAGISEADYLAFRERVNLERDLRDSILYSYQETCRP